MEAETARRGSDGGRQSERRPRVFRAVRAAAVSAAFLLVAVAWAVCPR